MVYVPPLDAGEVRTGTGGAVTDSGPNAGTVPPEAETVRI